MIHILYPAMCKLVSDIMSKFIKKKFLSTNYAENILIDVTRDTNHKSLKYIDIDVKAKTLFHETLFNDNEKYLKFCNECL